MLELDLQGNVATVTLNRPPVNAIDDSWIARMNTLLDELAQRSDWNVLLIRSAGKHFSAGFNLTVAAERFSRTEGAREMGSSTLDLQQLYARIESLPRVTIAEMAGNALGGGLELALACDLRVCAADALVGLPEARLGLLAAAGGTQRLSRLCGQAVARRLILGAEVVSGAEALALGMVQWAVPREELRTFASDLAQRYAAIPPHAVEWAKRCIDASGNPAEDGAALERQGAEALSATAATRALVDAFFQQKNAKRSA